MKGIRIGEVLVEQGILTPVQVAKILDEQQRSHRPFGDLAERLFGVSARAVEDAWVEQYINLAGIADLSEIEPDVECLRLLNRRQAWQFSLLPIGREEGDLQMATSAESLVRALNFATRRIHEPVYLLIARREQLREFLMRHYPVPQHIADYAGRMQEPPVIQVA